MHIPGFSSTGSKRPDALFGPVMESTLPTSMSRAEGCRVWDSEGRPYVDCIMALGAVALGYGYPAVNQAAVEAVANGVVGPLAPESEELFAAELADAIPWLDQVRFLKTGAEAMAAAVRIARAHTGRELVLGCGYHGWLDWCTRDDPAVPSGTRSSFELLRYDDPEDLRRQVTQHGDRLAAIIVEPVIDALPSADWLAALRDESARVGAVLVFDEIKTGCRLAIGGAAERFGVYPDLMVMGKALANGFPLALVGGRAEIMDRARRTWISSTLATEMVSLAAARATLHCMVRKGVPARLHQTGLGLFLGLTELAGRYPQMVAAVRGVPQMCYLQFRDESTGFLVARGCARRGLLFKRNAYNFVSLAHTGEMISQVLGTVEDALREVG